MKFATCLNCIDGRVQLPVIHWIKENYDIDYVDMITEAGMDNILVVGNDSNMRNILKKIDVSLTKHHSNIIFIVGHYDCAGNPVDEETHKQHIHTAVKKMKTLTTIDRVVGLWISKEWDVEKIIN
ncbi:MAG: carbonic anhydrase [Candidatus Anammoxibacter sp.]